MCFIIVSCHFKNNIVSHLQIKKMRTELIVYVQAMVNVHFILAVNNVKKKHGFVLIGLNWTSSLNSDNFALCILLYLPVD